jgi:hypothetical protein
MVSPSVTPTTLPVRVSARAMSGKIRKSRKSIRSRIVGKIAARAVEPTVARRDESLCLPGVR